MRLVPLGDFRENELRPSSLPLTSPSFFERRRVRHYKNHHPCYYAPNCMRCWMVASVHIFVMAVRMKA